MNSQQIDHDTEFALLSIGKMYKLGMIDMNMRKTLVRKAKAWAYDRLKEFEEEVLRAIEGGKTL